ncbi:MAG TPA: hypothetical protein PLE05_08090 [Bacillota bacterium]|nr:hypothetical protein [Bacillota bacterium]
MKKDLLLTFFTESIVLISGLIVYKFAANLVGKDAFSQYALCRRTVSFFLPALLMGLTVGMPRYIAYANHNSENKQPDYYFVAGISVLFINVFFFTGLLNIFSGQFAFLFFGNAEYYNLIFPISLMLIGLVLHSACYSYYRGKLLMVRANILQIINSGIIPILVFMCQADIIRILSVTGLSWVITSAIALILICKNLDWNKTLSLLPCGKELLKYGLQRVPGDFGMAALISLPAIMVAHMAGIKEAGYVAFGTTILNMTGALFAPFGLVLLPKASQLIASNNVAQLKEYILKLASFTFFLTAFGLIVFQVFADFIIKVYLGESFSELIVIARIFMLGSLATSFYVSMRSILDAYYTKAVNTINIIIALLFFLISTGFMYVLNGTYIALVGGFVAALYVLGALTFREIYKLMRLGVQTE